MFCCFPLSPLPFSVIVVANQLMRKCILFLLHFLCSVSFSSLYSVSLFVVRFRFLLLHVKFILLHWFIEQSSWSILLKLALCGLVGGISTNTILNTTYAHNPTIQMKMKMNSTLYFNVSVLGSFFFSQRFLSRLCTHSNTFASLCNSNGFAIQFQKVFNLSTVARWQNVKNSLKFCMTIDNGVSLFQKNFFMVTSKHIRPSAVTSAIASMHDNDKFESDTLWQWHRPTEYRA